MDNPQWAIITGLAGAGKSQETIKRAVSLPESEKVFIIVPEQYTYETEKRLLGALGSRASFNKRVASLRRIAGMVAASSPLRDATVLSEEARRLVFKHALINTRGSLSHFGRVAHTDGFADKALSFLVELKRNGVGSQSLLDASTRAGGIMGLKARDMLLLFEAYNAALEEGAVLDEESFYIECANSFDNSCEVYGAHLFFDGFASFDKCVLPLVNALAKNAKSASFSICYGFEESGAIQASSSETFDNAIEVFKNIGAAPEITCLASSAQQAPTRHIALGLFAKEPVACPVESHDSLLQFEAIDALDEIKAVAMEIIGLAGEGARFNEMAVACELETYAPLIEAVFAACGIEFYIDKKRSVAGFAHIKFLAGLGKLLEGGLDARSLAGLAKSGCFGIDDFSAMALESFIIQHGAKTLPECRRLLESAKEGQWLIDAADTLNTNALSFTRRLSGIKEAGEFCRLLYAFLEDVGYSRSLEEAAMEFASLEDYEMANTVLQVYNKLSEALENTAAIFSGKQIPPRELMEMIRYSLAMDNVGLIPASVDKLVIAGIGRSLLPEVKWLFAVGCNEESFPGNTDMPVFNEAERAAFVALGASVDLDPNFRKGKEQLGLYIMLAKPSSRLYLSRPASGPQGEAAPSQIFEAAKLVAPYGMEAGGRLPGGASRLPVSHVGKAAQSAKVYEAGLSFTNSVFVDDISAYKELVGDGYPVSISALERHSACPFSFFLSNVIRARPAVEFAFSAAAAGTALHGAMDHFAKQLIYGEIDLLNAGRDEIQHLMEISIEHAIKGFEGIDRLDPSGYHKTKLERAAMAAAFEISRQAASGFAPIRAEARFGTYGALPALDLGNGIAAGGIIDRIDMMAGEGGDRQVRVIDYKSGKADFDYARSYHGLSFQLTLYLAAAMQSIGGGIEGAGAFYFKLGHTPKKLDKPETEADTRKRIEARGKMSGVYESGKADGGLVGQTVANAVYNAKKTAARVSRGDISISPSLYKDNMPCTYCCFGMACWRSDGFAANKARRFGNIGKASAQRMILEGDWNGS
ncbi:MAG: PD-(D/E)XK nuclease family protein [Eubacteriaceae bacterium]|nr:PD-(D/E)XK nuclease family protein [Eubacteriaceae bacterium]